MGIAYLKQYLTLTVLIIILEKYKKSQCLTYNIYYLYQIISNVKDGKFDMEERVILYSSILLSLYNQITKVHMLASWTQAHSLLM